MMLNSRNGRNQRGSVAEAAAALSLMLPILFFVMFVALEASQAYMIKESLSQASRQAARSLSLAYAQDPSIQYDRDKQNERVFDGIRLAGMLHSSEQFDDAQWNMDAVPPTVSVTVHYTSNQYGLRQFPYFDPLHLAGRFHIVGTSKAGLE